MTEKTVDGGFSRAAARDTLMRQVWHYSLGVTSRTVDQHVARLRNKLEQDPTQPRHFITVRKAGYRFQP